MRSRDGSPVAAGFTSPPARLRLARACAVSFTSAVLDMNFWPELLVPVPGPPGDVPRSVIAKAHAVDRKNQDTATNEGTVFLKDLSFILSSVKGRSLRPAMHLQTI